MALLTETLAERCVCRGVAEPFRERPEKLPVDRVQGPSREVTVRVEESDHAPLRGDWSGYIGIGIRGENERPKRTRISLSVLDEPGRLPPGYVALKDHRLEVGWNAPRKVEHCCGPVGISTKVRAF